VKVNPLNGAGAVRSQDRRSSRCAVEGAKGGKAFFGDASEKTEPGDDPSNSLEIVEKSGAGDGNRTRIASLEGWNSAIELRPQDGVHRNG
jgi:hypothetical protein